MPLTCPCALQVNVGAGSHPNKVKVYGPGVAKTGLKAHEPTYFTVDCTEAGQGKALPWVGGQGAPRKSQPPLLPLLQVMSALASSVPLAWWAPRRPTSISTSSATTTTPSQSSTHHEGLAATPSWSSLLTRWVLLLLTPDTAGGLGAAVLSAPLLVPTAGHPH